MHLSEAEILLYLENKIEAGKRATVEEHVGGCAACAEQFAVLARLPELLEQDVPLTLDSATRQRAESLVQAKTNWGDIFSIFFRPRIALALVAIAAVGVTAYFALQQPQPSTFRESTSRAALELLSPKDGAAVDEHPVSFKWKSTSSPYIFSLYDDRGVVLWRKQTPDTMMTLPNEVELQQGKTYFWGVESSFSQQGVERSTLHAFTYHPSK